MGNRNVGNSPVVPELPDRCAEAQKTADEKHQQRSTPARILHRSEKRQAGMSQARAFCWPETGPNGLNSLTRGARSGWGLRGPMVGLYSPRMLDGLPRFQRTVRPGCARQRT